MFTHEICLLNCTYYRATQLC